LINVLRSKTNKKNGNAVTDGIAGGLDRETVYKDLAEIDRDFSRLSREGKKVIRKAWEDLLHYMDDEDIPVRDPEFGPGVSLSAERTTFKANRAANGAVRGRWV
jgi:hypothetical protein